MADPSRVELIGREQLDAHRRHRPADRLRQRPLRQLRGDGGGQDHRRHRGRARLSRRQQPLHRRQDAREPAALRRHPVRAEGRRGRARGDGGAEGGAVGRRAQRPEVLRGPARPVLRPSGAAPSTRRCASRMRFGAHLQPGWVERTKGARFRVFVAEPIPLPADRRHARPTSRRACGDQRLHRRARAGAGPGNTGGSTAACPTTLYERAGEAGATEAGPVGPTGCSSRQRCSAWAGLA